jgi:hypothetical protein
VTTQEAGEVMGKKKRMNEAEWLGSSDAKKMLESRYGMASSRKMRLAAVGCCRHVSHLLPKDKRCLQALEAAENYADRRVSRLELTAAHSEAEAAWTAAFTESSTNCRRMAANLAAHAIQWASHPTMRRYPMIAADHARSAVVWAALPPRAAPLPKVFRKRSVYEPAEAAELNAQVNLLRCVFGNPFRPIALNPSWLTPTVTPLAQAAYEHRTLPSGTLTPDRLAVLADALEDAGCTDADILSHLRGPGPHVRGCWVVDLLLGKS